MKSEKYYQNKIVKLLKDNGYYVIKTTPGLGIPTGTPDIIAFGRKTLFIEVKKEKGGILSPIQKIQIEKLRKLGYTVIATGSGQTDLEQVKKEIE